MKVLLDSSVLIAALVPSEIAHAECSAWIKAPDCAVYVHALNETFAILTGGGLGFRIDAALAAELIHKHITSAMTVVTLDGDETTKAHTKARRHGVRGGGVYDYMHLVAARKAGAEAIITLNFSDFQHLAREGDPAVRRP